MYQLKGGKQIKHFYDLPRGDKPTGIDASPKWFADISNSRDVRSKLNTGSTTLIFNFNSTSDTTTDLAKAEESKIGKRKRPQNQGYTTELGLKAATMSHFNPASTSEQSSLAIASTMYSYIGYLQKQCIC